MLLPTVLLLTIRTMTISLPEDLTVNKRSPLHSRPSFLLATDTIATSLSEDLTVNKRSLLQSRTSFLLAT